MCSGAGEQKEKAIAITAWVLDPYSVTALPLALMFNLRLPVQ